MTEQTETTAWPTGRPRLTHLGINVIDIDRMVEF